MAANRGLITLEDLRSYRVVDRKPLIGRYRNFEIISMPPPSSGGIALIQMLNILERFDPAALRKDSTHRLHLMVEAMRRAFADRARYLGDPDFFKVPADGLISKDYARRLAQSIDPSRATPSRQISAGDPGQYESPQTTHFSVVDAAGNAAAVTYTLNSGYGSGVTVKGAGFLLNNEMDDFVSRPGQPNQFGLIQGEANAIAPRKRPLSSMTPTIVLRDARLALVLGSPGGPTIINTVLHVLTNVVDLRMSLPEAVGAPRIHHQWMPDRISYESGIAPSRVAALRSMGHIFADKPARIGDVQAIAIDERGARTAVADPRSSDGLALAE
jgi:gamma-glutamyltranspeptidase/glutathione hydrolase